MAGVAKRLDSVEWRLDRIETNQREDTQVLRQHIDDGLKNVNQRIDVLTRWLIGIQVSSFIALTGLLVAILLKG